MGLFKLQENWFFFSWMQSPWLAQWFRVFQWFTEVDSSCNIFCWDTGRWRVTPSDRHSWDGQAWKWPQRKPQANYRYSQTQELNSPYWLFHIAFSFSKRQKRDTVWNPLWALSNSWITFANRESMVLSAFNGIVHVRLAVYNFQIKELSQLDETYLSSYTPELLQYLILTTRVQCGNIFWPSA